MEIKVSVIILNYNTKDLTCDCIKSILKIENEIPYEIILVDNASTECDPIIFEQQFPDIHVVKNDTNLGFSRGNNIGIDLAKGDYILLLNSDTLLRNDTISYSYRKLEADKTIGALSVKLSNPDGTVQLTANKFPTLKNELMELLRITKFFLKKERSEFFLGSEFDHRTEKECDWIWGTYFFFPKALLNNFKNKLLPDQFFMYGEDIDWCWKIKKLGFRIMYFPDAEIIHYGGASLVEEEEKKYFERIFPNTFKSIALNKGCIYAWALYFTKAFHLLTLRNRKDFKKAFIYFRFLFGKKQYWLNDLLIN